MASTEENNDRRVKTVEVWRGSLRDRRAMEIRETGVVVTHRFTSTTASPVEFQVIDPFPRELDVEEIGFHPQFEPPHGRIDGDQAVMSGVVKPDEEVVVTFGVKLRSPIPIEQLEELQVDQLPSIELSKLVDPDDVDEADLETATMARSTSAAEPSNGESVAFFDWLRRNLGADVERGESPATASEDDPTPGAAPTDDSGTAPVVNPDRPADTGAGAGVEDDTDIGSKPEAGPGPSTEASVAEGGASAVEPGTDDTSSPGEEATVETFLHELESGALTDDQRRRLSDALLDLIAADEATRPSTDIRLRKLESSMQEFEAYADALGAIIDEHGPAEEFLGEVRSEVDSLESAIADLRNDRERAEKTHDSFDDRLDAIADEVAQLASRLERLDDRVESMRANHRTRTASLEGQIESLEPAAERVEELSGAVDSLRADVDEVQRRHQAIMRALLDEGDLE